MKKINTFFEKSSNVHLVLFLCSLGIYFIYFHPVFFHLNSLLSSITNDSLKNYYTYVYHIKNDPSLLEFTGMNYPYGEHIVYTDCQPILTFLMRLMPFTHSYLVGIMHGLIFLSFIVSPLILYRIFRLLQLDAFFSFFVALALALLSPQFVKVNAGHFALAYGCLIPLSILYTLRCMNGMRLKPALTLFTFNTLLFLLHPYMGFCLSLFSFFTLLLIFLFRFEKSSFLKNSLGVLGASILPLLLFRLFMRISDHHVDRPTEPFGADGMVENIDSLVSPTFGPFQSLMEHFFSDRPGHYEGHTYLGFFTVLLSLLFLLCLPFFFKKIRVRRELLALLISAFIFLLISFGVHLKVLNFLGIQSQALNQFRAICRFAWIFYFVWPIFLVTVFHDSIHRRLNASSFSRASATLALLFFAFNLFESNWFFTKDESVFWKYRNFFHESQLNEEEKRNLASVRENHPQCILPLPLFHGGSEMFERAGSNNSMIPSMIYSFHSGTPIASVLMSRTSITETKNLVELMNSYKANRAVVPLLDQRSFLVIRTHDALLPDESRLLPSVHFFAGNDSLHFGYVSKDDLLKSKLTEKTLSISPAKAYYADSTGLVLIPTEARKPFSEANILDYETIFTLDSNRIAGGDHIISFHYHYKGNTYKSVATNLIVNQVNQSKAEWIYNIPVRTLSGFYNGFAIFEYRLQLERNSKYDFILKGFDDQAYHVSDFMLRPEGQTVIIRRPGKGTEINNFPEN